MSWRQTQADAQNKSASGWYYDAHVSLARMRTAEWRVNPRTEYVRDLKMADHSPITAKELAAGVDLEGGGVLGLQPPKWSELQYKMQYYRCA